MGRGKRRADRLKPGCTAVRASNVIHTNKYQTNLFPHVSFMPNQHTVQCESKKSSSCSESLFAGFAVAASCHRRAQWDRLSQSVSLLPLIIRSGGKEGWRGGDDERWEIRSSGAATGDSLNTSLGTERKKDGKQGIRGRTWKPTRLVEII